MCVLTEIWLASPNQEFLSMHFFLWSGQREVLIETSSIWPNSGAGIWFLFLLPTTNGGMQNGRSVGLRGTLHTRFCTFGTDLYAQSVLINKIFASELRRKFIKNALLVGFQHTSSSPLNIRRWNFRRGRDHCTLQKLHQPPPPPLLSQLSAEKKSKWYISLKVK